MNTNIERFENIHDGDRVFILGTGPSLSETPLEKLGKEYTISLNKIGLIFDETEWRPDYYVFDDAKQPQHRDGKMDRDLRKVITRGIQHSGHAFVSAPGRQYFGNKESITYYTPQDNQSKLKRTKLEDVSNINIDDVWQSDISQNIRNFGSTISITAQIAAYMGFEEIYFLGCDLYEEPAKQYMLRADGGDPVKYNFSSKHKVRKVTEMLRDSEIATMGTLLNLAAFVSLSYLPVSRAIDNNHFSEDYSDNEEYTVPGEWNRSLRKIHTVIQLASEKYNFDVYNATYGGYLEVYDRVDLTEVLSKK